MQVDQRTNDGAVHEGAAHDGADRGRDATTPSGIPARGWKDIAVRVKGELKEDHTSLSAAGVAFYGFLAAVPALAALVGIAGLVVEPADAGTRIEDLFGALPEEARQLLTDQLTAVSGSSGGALSVGIVVSILLSLWAAAGGMGHLVEAVNIAYGERESRGFVRRKLRDVALTLGAIVFGLLALGAIAGLPVLLRSLDAPAPVRWALGLLVWPVLGAGLAVGLAVLYRVGPDRDDPEWRWVSWGAVIAVVLWVIASIAFQVYTANFASYNKTYGSLAAVVVLLMWLWLSAYVVLLGAQINAEMEHQTAHDTTVGRDRPIGHRRAEMADTIGAPSS
jgi:membrane protein